MKYLILLIFIYLISCSSDKDNYLTDVEYYMKQGKEISIINKNDFKEVTKINKLILSKPIMLNNWLNNKLNNNNYLPRFLIDDFKKKHSIYINIKSFLVIKKNIYVIDENSNLIVLNEDLKEIKRKSIYKKKEFENYPIDFSMTSDGKSIYIIDNLGNVHRADTDTLKINWTLKLGVPVKSNLYINNNDLFFVNVNSKLYSVKSSNGEINWASESASKIFKEKYQISIENNLIITNNDYGEIYCLDLLKSNLIWKLSLNDLNYQNKLKKFKLGYPISVDGIAYFSSNYGETVAIELKSGRILWRKPISSTNLPIINNNYLFLLNEKGFFYILNKNNGDVIYSRNLNMYNAKENKLENFYNNIILGKDYIYIINSEKNLIKIDIHDLSSIKKDNLALDNAKDFFVINNHLYILEDKKLSKFYK